MQIGSKCLCIVGAGSWGTALAIRLSPRFETVALWARSEQRAETISSRRVNGTFLPGFVLPSNVFITADVARAMDRADCLLMATPSHALRATATAMAKTLRADTPIVSATKGLEEETLQTMSQVLAECCQATDRIAVLSGPTFAREVAQGEPAAVVIAARDNDFSTGIQERFAGENFRLYTTDDVIGVELGASLKNVIAIGSGICHGLGLGGNSVAALVTRGLAEITRLAIEMGGKARTLSGLAGLGDLVLTATGDLSRNRHVGIELGRGKDLATILGDMHMVAEGVITCKAAFELGVREGTELPIVGQMYKVLYEQKDPRTAIRDLMERPLIAE